MQVHDDQDTHVYTVYSYIFPKVLHNMSLVLPSCLWQVHVMVVYTTVPHPSGTPVARTFQPIKVRLMIYDWNCVAFDGVFLSEKTRASWRKHAHQCSSSRQHRENGSWSRRHWLPWRHLLTTVTPASHRWVVMATSRISQFPVEGLNFSMVLRRVFPSYLVL